MNKPRSNAPRSDAGDFGRLRHKDRQSHSWDRESSRIAKSTAKFTSLDGGGKSNLETGHEVTRARHQDLFNRHIGTLKGGRVDEAK
jgi:hypothetical protein